MKTKYKIPNKIYSLDVNSKELFELSDEGNVFFNQALQVLDLSIIENKVLLLYRGEKRDNLKNKLDFKDSNDLFYKFFHVGDKSKYLIKNNNFKKYLDDINDVSDRVFKIIFDKILEKQKENNAISKFKDYFTDIENKEDFLEKIINLNDKSKLRIRDYYFSYLHQDEVDENKSSFFVSTSKDIEVAEDEKFTGKGDNKIVIYYFISKPYIDLAIYSRNEPSLKKYCIDNDLPVYFAPFFDENEVCVKSGLIPNNILGVMAYIDNEEVFIVNPYLFFYYEENNLENFISKGLPVDREKFDEVLATTNYYGMLLYTEDNRFEEMKENR
ncbi:MAG: Unknown protein [uncultured Sulfurovum sp.]|uniref:Uncharacterized protein n=1 Tax=uncultured Sulfurovum sp. TaxID=269237 RepID=A0A6S6SII9_9BACT|nr:MAG: Unknown protein [uncultured Sulfurovum sp.]